MECTIARNNRKVFIHFFSGVRAPDLRFDEAKFDFPIFEFPAGFEFSGMMESRPVRGKSRLTKSKNLETRKGHFSINMCSIHLKI